MRRGYWIGDASHDMADIVGELIVLPTVMLYATGRRLLTLTVTLLFVDSQAA